MRMCDMKIVIATGGTGGHMIPAIRTAETLRERGHQIVFLGSFRLGTAGIEKTGFVFEDIGSCGLTSYRPSVIWGFAKGMVYGLSRSMAALRRMKPDCVVGFGGYPAFPVVAAARVLGLPSLIHEQNVVPGRANRILSGFVRRVAISFAETKRFLGDKKIVFTGCPCNMTSGNFRRDDVLRTWGLNPDRRTILVFGGSQGSRKIDHVFCEAILTIQTTIPVQVIHVAGRGSTTGLSSFYREVHIPAAVFEFCHEMGKAYTAADVVVARAGALTVTELGMLKKPAVLVPYPYAGGHQKHNARVLEKLGLATIIDEEKLTQEKLASAVLDALNGKMSLRTSPEEWERMFPLQPSQRLADEIENLV